jgi:tetratricopeptide (TPR) repeat protein
MNRKTLEQALKEFRQAHSKNDKCLEKLEAVETGFEKAKTEFENKEIADSEFQKRLDILSDRLSGLESLWQSHIRANTLENALNDFKQEHHQNKKCLDSLTVIQTDFKRAKAKFDKGKLTQLQFDKLLGALDLQVAGLKSNWESHVLKTSKGIGDKLDQDQNFALERKFEIYKQMFDWWQKTRDERADYNKDFFTKLFINTLVAVLVPLLATTGITAFTPLVTVLFLAVLVGAIAICLMWWLKLWALWKLEHSQRHTLKKMEESLELPFNTVYVWDSIASEAATAGDLVGVEINYYGLPLIMAIIFAVVLVFVILLVISGNIHLLVSSNTTNASAACLVRRLFISPQFKISA